MNAEIQNLLANRKYQWDYITEFEKECGYEDIIDDLNVTIPREFRAMTSEQQEKLLNEQLKKIRNINIFPIFYFNEQGIRNEILKVMQKDVYFDGDNLITQSSLGLLLLDYLFPNLHFAKTWNLNDCVYDRFYDDNKLKACLKRYMENYVFENMRTPFFMYARFFWNAPTNYLPMRAKAICEKFCPKDGVIYDYSCGYGGRMLGALCSSNNYKYIGCEPNKDTFANLKYLGYEIEKITGKHASHQLFNCCSEDLELPEGSIDFAFSCPPFYALEIYSDEETQSINKFKTYNEWLEGYIRPTIKHIYKALKLGGKFGIDISNFYYKAKKYFFVEDVIRIATEEGFKYDKPYPIISRNRKLMNNLHDIECLHIFLKEE